MITPASAIWGCDARPIEVTAIGVGRERRRFPAGASRANALAGLVGPPGPEPAGLEWPCRP